MTTSLDTVRGATAEADAAKARVRDAIVEAHAAGESAIAIAAAAGLTRQRVYQLVAEASAAETRDRARLAELDTRYERLVDKLAAGEGRAGDYKRVTALQNGQARKLARRGIVQPTVKQMLRSHAESKLLAVLDHRTDEPVVQGIRRDLDEAAALRKRFAALDDTRAFGSPLV